MSGFFAPPSAGSGNVRTDAGNTYTTGAQDFQAATSMLVPASASYAPTADASIGYDTTKDAYVAGGGGSGGGHTGFLERAIAFSRGNGGATDLNDAPTDGTGEKTFATTLSIPQNTIFTDKVLRVTAVVEMTTSASPPSLTLRGKLGSTNLYTGTSSPPTGNMTARSAILQWLIIGHQAVGASQQVEWTGPTNASGPVGAGGSLNTTGQPVAAIATNGALTLGISAQWSANTAGNSIRLRALMIEEVI